MVGADGRTRQSLAIVRDAIARMPGRGIDNG